MDINFICIQKGVFKAETESDHDRLNRFKIGSIMTAKVSLPRNYKFHKKFFALLNVGYDAFDPVAEHKGELVLKNFDKFRNDVTVLAGYHDITVDLDGNVKAIAKSISFASMDEEDFERLYSNVADVILTRVLKNYTRQDLDNVVMQILGFV